MRGAIAIYILTLAVSTRVLGACLDVPLSVFAKDLASAHASSALGSLDKKYAGLRPFQIFIEHSIGEGKDGTPIFVTFVPSFRALAELLQSRQTDGLPAPKSRAVRKCSNGICSYDFFTGIEHNSLYLKEMRYNDYVECLQIEVIWFLDGD
jgi:hypothetical protein